MAYLILVDDDEDFAMAAATVLRNAGHEVRIELSPVSALACMEERRPDLAILDVMFPEDSSSGFHLAATIGEQNAKLKGLPILMLSAVNSTLPLDISHDDITEYGLPVAEFLEKPVDFDVLLGKVAGMLAESSAEAVPASGNQ